MQETPQQYTQRILGFSEGKQPLRVQQATADKLSRLVKPLGKKQQMDRPAADRWSIAEILAHLADAEVVLGWRMRLILASDGAPIQAFDQDAWASTFNYRKRDPKTSLATFKAVRQANVALLKSVPKQLWDNYGMHSERGKETIGHLVKMMAGHDLNHLAQIEKIVKESRKKRKR